MERIAHDLAAMRRIGIGKLLVQMIDPGKEALLGVRMKRAVFVAGHRKVLSTLIL
jgi:hypothetical protein